jgi:hypothetical protein
MEEPDKGLHLPGWVRDWAKRLLPWAFMAIAGAGIGMFIDNIRTKDAVNYESFRNNQQDELLANILANQKRLEARQDRSEERAADKQKEDQEFQSVVLDGLQKLMKWMRR